MALIFKGGLSEVEALLMLLDSHFLPSATFVLSLSHPEQGQAQGKGGWDRRAHFPPILLKNL